MSGHWHWHNNPGAIIASVQMPTVPQGRLRVPARGPGSYGFGVDHMPHNDSLGTWFATAPVVWAFSPNGQRLAQIPVRKDRFGDKNVAVWDVNRGLGVGYYVVEWHLAPRCLVRGYGFRAWTKFRSAAR